jgi:hypothetical protein
MTSPNGPRSGHDVAAAKSDAPILHPTATGGLHSYSREELGVVNASSHPQVRSAGGFLVMAVFFAAVTVFSILLVAGPATNGHEPLWGALLLTAAGTGGAVYVVRMAGMAAKAKRLRAKRGIPGRSARQLDWGQDQNGQA